MESWIPTLRTLIALGLALLLSCSGSRRPGSAPPSTTTPSTAGRPSFRRRIAWYAIGLALVAAIFVVHPSPSDDLALGPGDRGKSIFLGLLYGAVGTAIAMGVALYRYRRLRFPDVWSYPGALLNSVITAIIDEVAFRGAVLGRPPPDRARRDRRDRHPGDPLRPRDAARGAGPEPLAAC